MKHKKAIIIITSITIFVFIVLGGIYHFFFDMNGLPQGEFINESTSPQGTYTIKLYEINPALSVGCTRGEVINNSTMKKRNIYWENNRIIFKMEYDNSIVWNDDKYVTINGKLLDVTKDTYDWRRHN